MSVTGFTRVYVLRGQMAHLLPIGGSPSLGLSALCNVGPRLSAWLGTGSQDEYDKAASLPLCKRCEAAARPEDSPATTTLSGRGLTAAKEPIPSAPAAAAAPGLPPPGAGGSSSAPPLAGEDPSSSAQTVNPGAASAAREGTPGTLRPAGSPPDTPAGGARSAAPLAGQAARDAWRMAETGKNARQRIARNRRRGGTNPGPGMNRRMPPDGGA